MNDAGGGSEQSGTRGIVTSRQVVDPRKTPPKERLRGAGISVKRRVFICPAQVLPGHYSAAMIDRV
ncbi:MAG: hypothetical protein H6671_13135 [Anaerolineaceae bacterium]|nr:hypothetical protein [Anaerolineaceae bacterium]